MKTQTKNPRKSFGREKITSPQRNFDEILLEAVDEALDALGVSVRKSLYFHLETNFSIKKETICKNPSVFSEGLRKIFGPGAKFIEKIIVEFLCKKTGYELNSNWQKCFFAENIQKIKEHFIRQKNQKILKEINN